MTLSEGSRRRRTQGLRGEPFIPLTFPRDAKQEEGLEETQEGKCSANTTGRPLFLLSLAARGVEQLSEYESSESLWPWHWVCVLSLEQI